MTISAEAWFLYPGDGSQIGACAKLKRERFEFAEPSDTEVLAEPLYGCWEGNMGHSIERKPVDICRLRQEDRVIIGNAGVVRILAVGKAVKTVSPGQRAVIFSADALDPYGYPQKILGYDSPGSMGCLATRMKLKDYQVVPIPENSKHSLAQWAAFSVRYITAWSNWELAYGTFRLLVAQGELPAPHVWGWGGGTTLAELDLARRMGCNTVMVCGNEKRLQTIAKAGITPLNRKPFGDLNFDERRFATDPAFRRAYTMAESAFLSEVKRRTADQMVHLFIDHIGTAVFRVTLKSLAREGVIATAGWKEGMVISFLRASECIGRHQHINTHYARYAQGVEAVAYGESNSWMPILDEEIFSYDRIQEVGERFIAGELGMFPVYAVNPE